MRFFHMLMASMLLSAAFGTALAKHGESGPAAPRAEILSPAFTWLWQPQMRRVALR